MITWRQLLVETAEVLGDDAEARWLCQEASGLEEGSGCSASTRPRRGERGAAGRHGGPATGRRAAPVRDGPLGLPAARPARRPPGADPRPETELLVEVALELAASQPDPLAVADLGTGSGAIALALADELFPRPVAIWACETDEAALDVARANLAGVGRAGTTVRMALGWWFEALPPELAGELALVVSNPPYLADDDPAVELPVRDWARRSAVRRPRRARRAARGDRRRARMAAARRRAMCEIGAGQGRAVAALAEGAGLVDVEIRPDLAGLDRILVARVT